MDAGSGKRAGWALALAGYLPFGAGTPGLFLPDAGVWGILAFFADPLLLLYGAVILSFLGGIRWGLALVHHDAEGQRRDLIASTVPSLWGWMAAFVGGAAGYGLLALGFAAMGAWDRALKDRTDVPAWFVALRLRLTLMVVPTMALAAYAVA